MLVSLTKKLLPIYIFRNILNILRGYQLVQSSFTIDNSVNILMNGPSLKDSLEEIKASKRKCMVVNHFADTDYFEQIRPSYYVIQDPYFWRHDVMGRYLESRQKTYSAISKKVNWPILLFLPEHADTIFVKRQIRNEHVRIITFYGRHLVNCCNDFYLPKPGGWLFYLWKRNIVSPPLVNVLVGSTYIAFLGGAKAIELYGGDMSYFKGLEVDQETNEVGQLTNYFYGERFLLSYQSKVEKVPTTMSYEFYRWASVFRVLSLSNELYVRTGLKVINSSKKSYLDMFPRSLQD